MLSMKTQSGENHAFSQFNVFPPRVDRYSIKPASTIWFYRGDPTLVKINVAITTGYLISGERNTRRAVQVSPKWNKCGNCRIRLIQMFRHVQTVGLLQWHASSTLCFPDLLLIFYYWKAIGDKFFVIHHVAALYAYYYVLVSALLSNSRTCRQDGKETTKSEQLRPPTLGLPIQHYQIHTYHTDMRKARVRSEVLDKEALRGREIINENTEIESDISGMDDLASS